MAQRQRLLLLIAQYAMAFAATLWWSWASAQTASGHCRADAADADTDRLPQARYTCVRLPSGAGVWLSEGGDPHRPAVMLIHGLGNNGHRDWRNTYPELTQRFHVIAFDLPGFGASDPLAGGYSFAGLAEVMEEIATQLSLSRFHLVGHSLGAAASLYFTDKHPERVDRLVLVDTAGVLLKQVFVRQLLEANRTTGVGPLDGLMDVLGQTGSSDRLLDLLETQFDVGDWLMSNSLVRNAVLGMPIHADAALGLVEHDFTGAIRNVHAPATVIWGAEDTVTPLRTGQLLAARMPDARLLVIGNAQHMPMVEQPEAFNRLLMSALIDPVPARHEAGSGEKSQGNVKCEAKSDMTYSGRFDRLSLTDCPNALVENAQLQRLDVQGGSVRLRQVVIDADDVALKATGATITGTAVTLSGDTALRTDSSRIDLAGATLRARDKAVDVVGPSRLYFSVSEIHAPDYSGDAHFIWPPPAKRQ